MNVTMSLPKQAKTFPFCDLLYDANHVLICGTTGSGKSVMINDYIYSLVGKYFPDELRFVLIDPKRVDLKHFCALPHVERYEAENSDIIKCLDDIIFTMEKRYNSMSKRGLTMYDGAAIVIIIDELADLMTTCKSAIMPRLQRIAQLGRASKIKLVCATQAPSRKVIPAELTVNFGGRVALRCLDAIESKQIIKRKGAELLPRYGKAIYLHSNGKYYEISVPLLPENELKERIDFWRKQSPDLDIKRFDKKPKSFFSELWNGKN